MDGFLGRTVVVETKDEETEEAARPFALWRAKDLDARRQDSPALRLNECVTFCF